MNDPSSMPPFAMPHIQEQDYEKLARALDPFGVARSLLKVEQAWMDHPLDFAASMTRFSGDLVALQMRMWKRAFCMLDRDIASPHSEDQRFADPEWSKNPFWDSIKQAYLTMTRDCVDMVYSTPDLTDKERRRAAFWAKALFNAFAPTNFFWTNPVALQKFVDSRGETLARGVEQFIEDVRAGDLRMVDPEPFHVGKNLATTPGAVVFRNRLLEVIQYKPVCSQVHEVPVVLVAPWINKYYILDLDPKKSLVRYLLEQGFTVFVTSWRNPPADMAEVRFEDYLTDGVDAIVDTAKSICGVSRVHAVGYCLGGTMLSIYMAWLNRRYPNPEEVPIQSWTLLASLQDFSQPGEIEVFLDEGSVAELTRTMTRRGYLEGRDMEMAFRMLRSNSLIWHYVVHKYLYGETPPPLDVLFWNTDGTRMPAAMHSYYLRELYINNRLIETDALTIAGQPIDLNRITQPLYAVSAEDDHIAPWRASFRVANFVNGPVRYVLSSSGHILGIINPPVKPPKRVYWAGPARRGDDPGSWKASGAQVPGSWWPDWIEWLAPQCGPIGAPPLLGNDQCPVLGEAPGTYVLEQ